MTSIIPYLQLNISGMDCADCALTLERGVKALPGVTFTQVNFSTAKMEVRGEFNPVIVTERVRQLGYGIVDADHFFRQNNSIPYGGLFSLLRYFLGNLPTTLVLIAACLMVISIPLSLWGKAGFMRYFVLGLQLSNIVMVGLPIARRGLRSLVMARKVTINLLMSIATVGALMIGEMGEAATVIILFALGEAIEGFTAERARDSLRSLLKLRPSRTTVLRPCIDCIEHLNQVFPGNMNGLSDISEGSDNLNDNNQVNVSEMPGNLYTGGPCPFCGMHEVEISIEEVMVGERVLVRPGEQFPVDGSVLVGTSMVNQAPITGESVPIGKGPGEMVMAGTINGDAAIEIVVTQPVEDSTINKIIRLVEKAQSQRAPVERFIDRFAGLYTPTVVGLAILFATLPPIFFGQPLFDTDGTRGWLYRALALLIVACPCALVISTPVTMVSALTGLAQRGILVKGGRFLDSLARIKTFAFDKTGTLTRGMPVVRQTWTPTCPPGSERCQSCDNMLVVAATLERRSTHPLAQAILAEVDSRQLKHGYPSAEGVVSLSGQGVQGVSNGVPVTIGSHTMFHEQNEDCGELHDKILAAEAEGQTVMLVGRADSQLGFIGVTDMPRKNSTEALHSLKTIDSQLRTVMLTGDNYTVAKSIASQVGWIDEVHAGLLPDEKLEAVNNLLEHYGPVAMVGDGVNDAPALAAATVGIAMGGAGTVTGGNTQAMETADMVLMQDNLTHLPDAVRTSRKTMGIIRQNIIFSLAIKGIFLLLTIPGWATLWMAVFADMGASLLVTANGMRARR